MAPALYSVNHRLPSGAAVISTGPALAVGRGYSLTATARPPLPAEVAQYTREHRRRLTIKPGITGPWQVSGRSDMVALDIMHLKEKLFEGFLDVGLIIVPDNDLSKFLTDRTPNLATAIKHIEDRARDLPIRVIAFRHNGPGSALDKMRTNLGRQPDA